MKRILVAIMILVTSIAGAQTFSTSGPANPMPVNESAISALVAPAAPTFTVLGTAQLIGSTPAGCHTVWISASGPINIGGSGITVGVNGGILLADATTMKFNLRQDTTAPAIYVINYTSGATATVRLTYGK